MSGPIISEPTTKSESKRITIDPITRLEGHGKIEIFLNDEGNVANAYWQVPELRGFEKFCIGRSVDELNKITPRLCGVCPGAHHLCSTKALDGVFQAEPPEAGRKLRELFYAAHYIHSHIAHFYALAAADFVLGPAAPAEKRNILGVVDAVGVNIGSEVIKHRSYAQKVQEMLGGKATHPVCGIPGGMSKPINEDERKQIEEWAKSCVEFSKFTMGLLGDVVLKNEAYLDLIKDPGIYYNETYYMGLVDKNNKINFYDGDLRVVDQKGKEVEKFHPSKYLDHIGEHVEPWTYEKFCFLKKIGWNGFTDGPQSGIYRCAPLARVNASTGFTTPEAQKGYEQLKDFFKGLGVEGPIHHTMIYHWARVIELMHASEWLLELSQDPMITSKDIKSPTKTPGEGIGCLEAPRGVLIHHYVADENGITTDVNLVVGTTNNNAPINLSVRQAAKGLIKNWQVSPGILNEVEMAYRAYDPCNSCATHTLPGQMPLKAVIRKPNGEIFQEIQNF
ncbi:Ni/Fe hydrogenase subunit alpha [Methanomassiliicoccus luminyensis]|uniref:Ni/Fe hydrogenase subunit alpha n=1 Tax=Methanomassiliicoccus luminyensis TaxID=1080712 RepID=UPI000379E80A|nr:Ni/Fe hydrogenase subunit alpha [Methanomassiliicoccus luminyensis]